MPDNKNCEDYETNILKKLDENARKLIISASLFDEKQFVDIDSVIKTCLTNKELKNKLGLWHPSGIIPELNYPLKKHKETLIKKPCSCDLLITLYIAYGFVKKDNKVNISIDDIIRALVYSQKAIILLNLKESPDLPSFIKKELIDLFFLMTQQLRDYLLTEVFGQSAAIHQLINGIHYAHMQSLIDSKFNDTQNTKPSGIFLFAGPPGVGKTHTAQLCSDKLRRPFRRFDMTAYHDEQTYIDLIGVTQSYQYPRRGQLTKFVEDNPDAILLFDEIEKAGSSTIQLFYQILDTGKLEDRFTGKNVSFKNTIIFFTTNAGKCLYNNPNRVGIYCLSPENQKNTLLSSLEQEINPITKISTFPKPLCTRLAQGELLLFRHLNIQHLEKIAEQELCKKEAEFREIYNIIVTHDKYLPITLVYKHGGFVEARQIKSAAAKFILEEIHNYRLQHPGNNILDGINRIHFRPEYEQEEQASECPKDVKDLVIMDDQPPTILVIASDKIAKFCKTDPRVNCITVSKLEDAIDTLNTTDVTFVLLDLWLGAENLGSIENQNAVITQQFTTSTSIDLMELTLGRIILQTLYERFFDVPVYLLSCPNCVTKEERIIHQPIDDELLQWSVRSGGVRDVITADTNEEGTIENVTPLFNAVLNTAHLIYFEKTARKLSRERKILSFGVIGIRNSDNDKGYDLLKFNIRNFRLVRSLEADDISEVYVDSELPLIRFKDVIGIKEAKSALTSVVNWLKDQKFFKQCSVNRPPKGILLCGPPGTGKTFLAKAFAGEAGALFIERSGSSFISREAGSGPEEVRKVFLRARKYAPSILLIDEIDAFGRRRGGSNTDRAEEKTLNAFLEEMDGFHTHPSCPVIIVAATNLEDDLDPALKRRFDRIIHLNYPDHSARKEFLEKEVLPRCSKATMKKAIEIVSKRSSGMSLSDLERVVYEATMLAANNKKPLKGSDLTKAFEIIRTGDTTTLGDEKIEERIAVHEAGHTLISWFLSGQAPLQVTICSAMHAAGYVETETDENKLVFTKRDLEQQICITLGGRAAEQIFYDHSADSLSTACRDDLLEAQRLAVSMVCEYGMGDNDIEDLQIGDTFAPITDQVRASINKIIRDQYQRTLDILQEKRSLLKPLIKGLMKDKVLMREDLQRILEMRNVS